MKLLVGLGNPGLQYERTRHNIGFIFLEAFAKSLGLESSWRNQYKGRYQSFENSKGDKIHLLQPLTYMNLSGESVRPLANFFKIKIEDILVIHDELDLPFGALMFKEGGGLAGHNGLRSIKEHLSSQDFKRMRLGIGRPLRGTVSDWVLSSFSSEESFELDEFVDYGVTALKKFSENTSFSKLANTFNRREKKD